MAFKELHASCRGGTFLVSAACSRPSTLETDQSTVQLYLCPEFLKKSHLSGNLVKRLDRNTFKEDHNFLFSIA